MPQASQARQVSQVPQGLSVQRAQQARQVQQVPPEQAAVLQAPQVQQVLPEQRVQPEQRAQQVLVLLALPALLVLQG